MIFLKKVQLKIYLPIGNSLVKIPLIYWMPLIFSRLLRFEFPSLLRSRVTSYVHNSLFGWNWLSWRFKSMFIIHWFESLTCFVSGLVGWFYVGLLNAEVCLFLFFLSFSLFHSILSFIGYLMPKPSLLKNTSDTI